jgi:hypothetical protein
MIYQSDPNTNRRSDIRDDALYTHWITGGVVTLAIVIAAAAFISTGSNRDLHLPQITTTVPCSSVFNDWLRYGPLNPANRLPLVVSNSAQSPALASA